MAGARYPQFCALARAAEIVAERWTLLIVRELLLGPRRFSDLRARLDGVSTSVLSARLARLETLGLVHRTVLAPPAATGVYELSADGRALEPAVFELLRWGTRFLLPPRRGERWHPDWVRVALAACARKGPVPARSFAIRMPAGNGDLVLHVAGGPRGTTVSERDAPADATIRGDAKALLALASGALAPGEAIAEGRLRVEGDASALALLPQLFTMQLTRNADPKGGSRHDHT